MGGFSSGFCSADDITLTAHIAGNPRHGLRLTAIGRLGPGRRKGSFQFEFRYLLVAQFQPNPQFA